MTTVQIKKCDYGWWVWMASPNFSGYLGRDGQLRDSADYFLSENEAVVLANQMYPTATRLRL